MLITIGTRPEIVSRGFAGKIFATREIPSLIEPPATGRNFDRVREHIVRGALDALKRPSVVDLHTDSQYVKDGITGWIHGWKRNGWKTADKKPVKNVDLWQRLDAALKAHNVRWHWVKGHAGHAENERADELAREGMATFKGKRR